MWWQYSRAKSEFGTEGADLDATHERGKQVSTENYTNPFAKEPISMQHIIKSINPKLKSTMEKPCNEDTAE